MKARVEGQKSLLVLMLGLYCLIQACMPAVGQAAEIELLRVVEGKSIVLPYHEKIKTVSLADQEIADVISITGTQLVVIGKLVGTTSLIVWGESGGYNQYEIEVDRNVTGKQIVLEVQVAEVNRTALSEYGVDLLVINTEKGVHEGEQTIGSFVGGVTSPDAEGIIVQDGVTTFLKWLGREEEVSAAIKLMKEKGNLKLLANPRLISLSGQEASFLVGGEIPIPIAQTVSGSGVNAITIEWKEYGVRLNFLPTLIDTSLINLRITPEVSSLDQSNTITFAGFAVPSLRTRRADATVEMNSGQSLVLGGLLATEEQKSISRVPILGYIPLLDLLFSHKRTKTVETELLIVVSPRVIESIENETIPPLPGQATKRKTQVPDSKINKTTADSLSTPDG